ncbi:hypothetical protein [Bradyrhizobium sp. Arg816]|uniref:hypothetical protein n=1 Tax=Bradyrhizobium sp. Arg816 TaxID=2998491 RepID=UPI00249EF9DC|nr:hypothetical protein [Bradyrhizobium sp. Arg816]MDI3561284.1 hypothetical protein [Bradyrhizobium sp. Arg816]
MSKAATKTIIASSCSQQYQNADRAELLSYGRATGRFNDDNAPWTFKFELSGDGKSTAVDLTNDAAITQAMMIIGFAAELRLLSKVEMGLLQRIVARGVIDDRQHQLIEKYNAGEISKQDLKRLEREARHGSCWPTRTLDDLEREMVPLLQIAKRRQGAGIAAR